MNLNCNKEKQNQPKHLEFWCGVQRFCVLKVRVPPHIFLRSRGSFWSQARTKVPMWTFAFKAGRLFVWRWATLAVFSLETHVRESQFILIVAVVKFPERGTSKVRCACGILCPATDNHCRQPAGTAPPSSALAEAPIHLTRGLPLLHGLPAALICYHGRQWDMVKTDTWPSYSICQCELSSDSPPLVVVVSEWPTLKKSLKPLEQKALEGLRLLKATSGLSNMHTNNIITAEWFGERVYFVVVAVTFYSWIVNMWF